MSTLATALEDARSAKGLSKRAAASTLGCSEMTYSMWARGVWTPDVDRVNQLADFTGKDRVEVLGLLGVLDEDQVATLMAKRRGPSPSRRKRTEHPVAAPSSATLSEDQGAYLSGPISVPVLALVA